MRCTSQTVAVRCGFSAPELSPPNDTHAMVCDETDPVRQASSLRSEDLMMRARSSSQVAAHDVPPQNENRNVQNMQDRSRTLSTLLPLWPNDLNDSSYQGRMRVLAHLRRALRKERQRGRSGHWSYNLARHRALLDSYRDEAKAISDHNQQAHSPVGLARQS